MRVATRCEVAAAVTGVWSGSTSRTATPTRSVRRMLKASSAAGADPLRRLAASSPRGRSRLRATGATCPGDCGPTACRWRAWPSLFPRVFAVGYIRVGSMKRVAAASGEGSSVVPLVHAWLGEPGVEEEAMPEGFHDGACSAAVPFYTAPSPTGSTPARPSTTPSTRATARSSRPATCSSWRRPTPRVADLLLQGRRARLRPGGRRAHAGVSATTTGTGCTSGRYVLANPAVGMLLIDLERGHRMRLEVRRPSSSTTPCSTTIPRPSSWSGSEREPSTRTVPATSTATSWCVVRGWSREECRTPCPAETLRLGVRRLASATRPRPRRARRA